MYPYYLTFKTSNIHLGGIPLSGYYLRIIAPDMERAINLAIKWCSRNMKPPSDWRSIYNANMFVPNLCPLGEFDHIREDINAPGDYEQYTDNSREKEFIRKCLELGMIPPLNITVMKPELTEYAIPETVQQRLDKYERYCQELEAKLSEADQFSAYEASLKPAVPLRRHANNVPRQQKIYIHFVDGIPVQTFFIKPSKVKLVADLYKGSLIEAWIDIPAEQSTSHERP